MTLILGTITGLLLGLCFGRNRATLLVTAVAWYSSSPSKPHTWPSRASTVSVG
jgi:hypothetical protein